MKLIFMPSNCDSLEVGQIFQVTGGLYSHLEHQSESSPGRERKLVTDHHIALEPPLGSSFAQEIYHTDYDVQH